MPASFSVALAGLSAHAAGIDAVGNNLANLNSTAFKSTSVTFRDLVTQSIGIGNEAGLGTSLPNSARYFTQGTIQSSSGPMDAAIKGDGFFVVRGTAQNSQAFTRAGNFRVDANGFLVTLTKERVQGWVADSLGVLSESSPITDIQLPVGTLQTPNPTTTFAFDLNLDASAAAGATFSSPIQVFDSLGVPHQLTATFVKTGSNAWTYQLDIAAAEVGQTGAPVSIVPATAVTFNNDGTLATPIANVAVPAITPLASGAADLNLTWQFFTPSGAARMTQFASPSAVSSNSQDGSTASQLVKIALDQGGQIVAQFSSGQQRVLAQLALANIRNPESLRAIGNNNFQLGADSALPALGLPDTGGRGAILGGALEGSNVDIAKEFTNLIILQRGYQANSRVVVTSDEISQETINLKR